MSLPVVSWIRPIEWLDRNPWGDVHDDAVPFTLMAPVGRDMFAGHLTLQPWALATRPQMVTARQSRGTRYRRVCSAVKAPTPPCVWPLNRVICVGWERLPALV